jgi:capsular polysaccharide biosynthesis protein
METRPVSTGNPSVLPLLASQWRRIAIITVAVTVLAWGLTMIQPVQYQASALISVIPRADALQPNEVLRAVEVLERRTVVATIASLASTPAIRSRVAAASEERIEAVVLPNTNLIRVNVQGRDPGRAALVANRVPALLGAQARSLYRYYDIVLISAAAPPQDSFAPRPRRAIAAGLVAGLFLGLLAAYVQVWRKGFRPGPA